MLFIIIYSLYLMVSAEEVHKFNCSEAGYGNIINKKYSGYKKVILVQDHEKKEWVAESDTGGDGSDSILKFYTFLFGESVNINDINSYLNYDKEAYPNGKLYRAELFNEHSGVHFPAKKYFKLGKSRLILSNDMMQTAVNALFTIITGNLDDIYNLPAKYVLMSTRTISMLEISVEKMSAMWTVIKDGRPTGEITYETLALFRPLFQFVTGSQMAQLNFSDPRIINFIGSHSQLSRYQLAAVANAYVKFNPNWTNSYFMNLLNNIVCGLPIAKLKEIPPMTYLRLSEQFFHSVRSCDKLQMELFAIKMMKTEVLGHSYSWGSRDVMKMGLLLDEVAGGELKVIKPEAMAAITGQVVQRMTLKKFSFFTDQQLKFMGRVPLTILSRRLSGQKKVRASIMHGKSSCSVLSCLLIMLHLVYYII